MSDLSEPVEEVKNSAGGQNGPKENDGEPKSGVSPAEVPYPHPPDDDAAKETDGSYDWWRNLLAALALLISLFALGISIASWRTAEKTFYTTHRATVYLGLPDGKIGEVGPMGKGQGIELYFRNYGPTAARDVAVEVWPIVNTLVSRAYTKGISPPRGKHYGPSLPPGFPLTISQRYSGATKEELDLRQKYLSIVGRVRYGDSFSEYCEPFYIEYISGRGFVPSTSLNPFPCEGYDEIIWVKVERTKDGNTWLSLGPTHPLQEKDPDQHGEK